MRMKPWNQILRELREDHDCSQAEIAKILGTTQQVYSRYENGVNEIPLHHLRTLCLYYQVSADEVLSIPGFRTETTLSDDRQAIRSDKA